MLSINNELLQGKFFLNIALHITFLFTILGSLFIIYISNIASTELNNHLIDIIDNYFNKHSKSLTNYNQSFYNHYYINNNSIDYNYYNQIYSQPEITRTLVNHQVTKKIINVNILLVIITILLTIILLITKNINYTDIKQLLFENIISFSIVGIIEFLFFTKIALKYVPAPPSLLLNSLITNLKN